MPRCTLFQINQNRNGRFLQLRNGLCVGVYQLSPTCQLFFRDVPWVFWVSLYVYEAIQTEDAEQSSDNGKNNMRRSKEEHGTSQSNDAEHNKAGVWSFLQNCRGLWRLLFWLRSCFLNFNRSRSDGRRGSRGTGGGSSGRSTVAGCLFLFGLKIFSLYI